MRTAVHGFAVLVLVVFAGGCGRQGDTVTHGRDANTTAAERQQARDVRAAARERREASRRLAAKRAQEARARRRAARSRRSSGVSARDRASFAALQRRLGGRVGVALSAQGLGQPVTRLGTWTSGPAWSTSKVPVAVAVIAQQGGQARSATASTMTRAITASDNAAAEALWSDLGSPTTAGAKVQRVLAAAGDARTVVQTQRVRPGFTAFGQTSWSLSRQAKFAAALPCLADARPVLDLMGQVEADQQWGIGRAGGAARFKGGWGPNPGGGYLVRQLGLLTLPNGEHLALAVASEPGGGSFQTGTSDLTALAEWVAAHARGSRAPPRC